MKKFIAIILVGCMMLSLIGCGANTDVSDKKDGAGDNIAEQQNTNNSKSLKELGVRAWTGRI